MRVLSYLDAVFVYRTAYRKLDTEAYTPRPVNHENSLVGAFPPMDRLLITPGVNLRLVARNLAICAYCGRLYARKKTYHHF